MACGNIEVGAVLRLRSEVNILWRKVVRGDTMVDEGDGGAGGVSVGVYPITPIKWKSKLIDIKFSCNQGVDWPHSAIMKNKVLNLMDEIYDLEGKVDMLTQVVQTSTDTSALENVPKFTSIESLTNQVALIKKLFKQVREEGREAFMYLEGEKREIEKDVKALKDIVNEEFSSGLDTKVQRERRLANKTYDNFNKVLDVYDAEVENYRKNDKSENLQRQKAQEMNPIIMPCFSHSWEEKDHLQFVKVYRRHRMKQRRMEEWQRILPYKTENDVLQHCASYETFLNKKDQVKNKLIQWKSEKEKEQTEIQEKISKEKIENEKKMESIRKAKEERLKEEQEEKYKKIIEWKKTKGVDRITGEKIEERVGKSTRKQNKMTTRERKVSRFTDEERKNIGVQLQAYSQWKDQQKREEMQKKQEDELLKKKLYSASNRNEFCKKDEQYIKSKRDRNEMQIRNKEEQKKRLEKIKASLQVSVEKSKNRLYEPTISHTAYKLSSRAKESSCVSVDEIPRLGTPVWRLGI
ncbi:calponin homology domain-containing protein DDB_G0272472-like [Homarus americanus]|uniref:calponin homology domain-containing protein DDB_G0272472-like n=1 Tax=Homarus americanus TaxID=6706 RepID=UPI001C47B8BC|nr:calponin homology domain-containing protein DDB_G0272472-like [Homarus americanus]